MIYLGAEASSVVSFLLRVGEVFCLPNFLCFLKSLVYCLCTLWFFLIYYVFIYKKPMLILNYKQKQII